MKISGQFFKIRWGIACTGCLLLLVGFGINLQAQQAGTTSHPSDSAASPQTDDAKATEGRRVLGFMPNRLTVEDPASHPPVLTSKQKFGIMAANTFDPFEFGIVAVVAGIGQAHNSPKAWGQGWDAYGKRYAASFADQASWKFMTEAALPSLLKEDPRYYRMGQGGAGKRMGYAITRIFVTRTDSGRKTFNIPEIAGAGIATGISNAYYPRGQRSFSENMSRWGFLIGEDAALNVLKEFWPDIRHHIFK
jgi:hypothetical protein